MASGKERPGDAIDALIRFVLRQNTAVTPPSAQVWQRIEERVRQRKMAAGCRPEVGRRARVWWGARPRLGYFVIAESMLLGRQDI